MNGHTPNGGTHYEESLTYNEDIVCVKTNAELVLRDGRTFEGYSFGYERPTTGEVVFNTGMVGYPESLTDPSYKGQLLVLTYPLIGNYGVPGDEVDELGLLKHFEGSEVYVKGLIVANYTHTPSHWKSHRSLGDWLKEHKIPAISGVDTRAITKHIRHHGSMLGKLVVGNKEERLKQIKQLEWYDPNLENLAAQVSHPHIRVYDNMNLKDAVVCKLNLKKIEPLSLVLVDCGCKFNMIRYLLYKLPFYVKLKIVPWDYDFGNDDMDGLFISNGPGDPKMCNITIENIRKVMNRDVEIPILGVCLGHQLMALAIGSSSYKMKFGNRGMNQPVIDLRTNKCYITPQNHGFAVDSLTLPDDWMELFINANDHTNEGIIHKHKPWIGVQFHPEACGGPTDTSFLFNRFLQSVCDPATTGRLMNPFVPNNILTKVLILGSGGLTIGQAGEFDYSGSQAIKALREANITVILINPNIATVQTSDELAHQVYFLPVTPEFVAKVIDKERPDGLLCTFGGQTALNCAIELNKNGTLKKYGCKILGSPIQSILETEDRGLFASRLKEIGEKCAASSVAYNIEQATHVAKEIGYPVLVRTAFALGGLGSGFAQDEASLLLLCKDAFSSSKQVLIDKSLKGWKEVEYEVLRDNKDNCLTICNMENLDPLGIHTGDSIVISPSQTLSNEDYYKLRECAIKVIRHFNIIGECNIQFALDPHSNTYCIVEVNARLSRSSALASKATGYPLAYISAKLALGWDLTQLRNCVTKITTACCEPSLDYVVTKIPRWDLDKFENVNQMMGSAMKSVGEVMAIGRTFEESIQKALRMVEEMCIGFQPTHFKFEEGVRTELMNPSPRRIWAIAQAFQLGISVHEIYEYTHIDKWFLNKLYHIHCLRMILKSYELQFFDHALMKHYKQYGFSDEQIGIGLKTYASPSEVRTHRYALDVFPVVKQIDTLAAEFPAPTNYLYLTYQGTENDIPAMKKLRKMKRSDSTDLDIYNSISSDDENITTLKANSSTYIVLGCGCYRIGSSVEFDWSAINCIKTLRRLGHRVIVVNCNPETVSTDYDESDRLYFEELSLETILNIWRFENAEGIIISVGGQTPNNLAIALSEAGVKILGTPVSSIDQCEDRNKFSKLCDQLGIDQPEWSTFTDLPNALEFCYRVKFPVLVRPSYVLSGAAMKVVYDKDELARLLEKAAIVSRDHPVVISKYVEEAKEVEMDSVAQDGKILNFAISEHVENAGVHSGDATLILPAHKLYVETTRQVKRVSQQLAKALKISGPFNIQFLCKNNEIKIIECNLRVSRTFPFISKTYKINLVEQATRVMIKAPVRQQSIHLVDLDYVGVKMPMFSFTRLRGSDPVLGVEMRSTGEVACYGKDKYEAYLKASISSGMKLPTKNILLSVGPNKIEFLETITNLLFMKFTIYCTESTYNYYYDYFFNNPNTEEFATQIQRSQIILAHKPSVKKEPNSIYLIEKGHVELVVCIQSTPYSRNLSDGFLIRRAAMDSGVSLISNPKQFVFMVESISRMKKREAEGKPFWEIKSWNEYVAN